MDFIPSGVTLTNSSGKEYLLSKISYSIPISAATATGTTGEIRVGSDGYIYWCIVTNTWIRAQGLTF